MNKRKRLLMPIIFISGSIGLITINHVFSYYSFKANDINISISGISTKLGDDDYYLYWNNSNAPLALTKSSSNDNEYTYTIKTEDTGTYSYRIVDQNNKEVYSQDSFELGLYGDFNLSFNSENTTSSLTYDFYIKDTYSVLESSDCTPSSSLMSLSNGYYITGSFCSWNKQESFRMFTDTNSTDVGRYKNIYLTEGDSFKITNFSSYYGYSQIGGGNDGYFKKGSDDNIVVNSGKSGYYSFYLNSDYKIYIDKSTDQGMFWDDSVEPVIKNNTYTYTIDAIKYGSGNTYLNFYDSNKDKYIEPIQVKDIKSSREVLLCEKYIYLVPDVWNVDSAWFIGEVYSNDNDHQVEELIVCSTNSTYYKFATPIGFTYCKFRRMNSSYTYSDTTIDNVESRTWDSVDAQGISSDFSFLINGWAATSITTNPKPNDEAKFSLSTVD